MRIVVVFLLALLASPAIRAVEPADTIFWGGPIYTADDARPRVEAVAVRRGRIVFAGNRKPVEGFRGTATTVIDLKGATLFPGFTDAHAHLMEVGERELILNLEGTPSIAELQEEIRRKIATSPPGALIFGRGWIETHWPEGRFPDRADLDAVAPDQPVILERADGHAVVVNSKTLSLAGIDRATLSPPGGAIRKDEAGEPTGMIIDDAMPLVAKLIPEPTPEFKAQAFRAAFAFESGRGWTGIHSMSVPFDEVLILEEFAKRGEAGLRVYNAVTPEGAERLLREGPRNSEDGRIITRTLKFYMDGALGSRGAALFYKYDDDAGSGLIRMRKEDVLPIWEDALRKGIQVTTHAIGDRANHQVLDWYEEAFKAVPSVERRVDPPRWRVEHAQILALSDIPRFARLGVIPSMQASHAIGDLDFAPKRLGEDRLAGAYAWSSLIKAGSIIPGGSDAPVERGDPLIEFYAAVARKALDGHSGPDWHPEQAVDRRTALRMFTVWPAYASFREADLGAIRPGMRADFSVFSRDLMQVPAPDILKARALMTMIDGKTVYRATDW